MNMKDDPHVTHRDHPDALLPSLTEYPVPGGGDGVHPGPWHVESDEELRQLAHGARILTRVTLSSTEVASLEAPHPFYVQLPWTWVPPLLAEVVVSISKQSIQSNQIQSNQIIKKKICR